MEENYVDKYSCTSSPPRYNSYSILLTTMHSSIMQFYKIDRSSDFSSVLFFSRSLVESHVRIRIYVSSYKRWASFPPSRLPLVGPRVQLKLLPAFLMSDRKRVACVIYARDFSPGRTGCAVFLHIVRTYVPMQNRSCRISVISVDPARVVSFSRHGAAGRKLTTVERGTVCTGGKKLLRCQDSAISFRYCE